MAKLPAVVQALARFDRRELSAVDHLARAVREAGLVQTTKRGRGSASMTYSDAATLMIGVVAAETPKDGPSAVLRFRDLPLRPDFGAAQLGLEERFPGFISPTMTFGEVIQAMIEQADQIAGWLTDYIRPVSSPSVPDWARGERPISLEEIPEGIVLIKFGMPGAVGKVRFGWFDEVPGERFIFEGTFRSAKLDADGMDSSVRLGRRTTFEIGLMTLLETAYALKRS